MPLGMEVGLRLGDIVLGGDVAPPLLKGHSPHFRPMSVVAKRLYGLGVQVGLGPGDFVLDGDAAPPEKRHIATQFWPMSIVTKRLDGSKCHLVRR